MIPEGKVIPKLSVENRTDDSLDSEASEMKITEECLVPEVPPATPAGPAAQPAPSHLLGALDVLPTVAPGESQKRRKTMTETKNQKTQVAIVSKELFVGFLLVFCWLLG